MSTSDQIAIQRRGGGRELVVHRAVLTFVSGQVGVTGSGSITGGAGGTTGSYPLAFTGGIVAANGAPAAGTFTVAGGAVTAINITYPGQYTTAPTAFSFAAATGLTGVAATPTTAQAATMTYSSLGTPQGYNLPPGSFVSNIKVFTPIAFTGSPTAVNLTIGATLLGADYVAATNVQAQGVITPALVGAGLSALRNVAAPIMVTAVVAGSTTAAGTVEVELHYCAPNP